MSRERYDEECPGCRPAILDVKTGKALPDDDPLMVKMLAVWAGTTHAQREAFHRVTCLNSRDPIDLLIVEGLVANFKA